MVRYKPAFRAVITKKGRVTAADLFIVQENGPYSGSIGHGSAARAVSLLFQPPAMRY